MLLELPGEIVLQSNRGVRVALPVHRQLSATVRGASRTIAVIFSLGAIQGDVGTPAYNLILSVV